MVAPVRSMGDWFPLLAGSGQHTASVTSHHASKESKRVKYEVKGRVCVHLTYPGRSGSMRKPGPLKESKVVSCTV